MDNITDKLAEALRRAQRNLESSVSGRAVPNKRTPGRRFKVCGLPPQSAPGRALENGHG